MAVRKNYEHYAIEATTDFELRCIEDGKQAGFFFEPGISGPVIVYSKPSSASAGVSAEYIQLALERIVAHLQSVGYEVEIVDG